MTVFLHNLTKIFDFKQLKDYKIHITLNNAKSELTLGIIHIQCNLDLVTLLVSAETVTKSHNVTKSNDFM